MSEEKNNKEPSQKSGFPSSFFLILFAVVLVILTIQNFITDKRATVGFSHQLEPLVNLNLIDPEESRKISLNDNLVTFSGKFREEEPLDAKQRYHYLELLENRNVLLEKHSELLDQLTATRKEVQGASTLFLELSGAPIPLNGYLVVEDTHQIEGKDLSVTIHSLPTRNIANLPLIQDLLANASSVGFSRFERELTEMIELLRSPKLGIGSDPIKQELKNISKEVHSLASASLSNDEKMKAYQGIVSQLQGLMDQLNTPVGQDHLVDLRSVRTYRSELDQLGQLVGRMEQNELQLEQARIPVASTVWFFNNKEISTRALERQDAEAYSQWFVSAQDEWNQFAQNRGLFFRAPDQPRNLVLEKKFQSEDPAPNYLSYFFTLLPIVLVIFFLYFIFSRQMKGVGGSAMTFGKSPARLLQKGNNKITFKDVAGIDEAKEELVEIVDFLKNPIKFTHLGGRIPKGVLLIGPPGTGKTLIAKAVAGEADRPFFSIAGSDFVEMFVGVGASRIRDMFDQAKKNSPCIIFIDEIDAVGRHRGAGIGGGHDEREQTLNQLLVEMDGFDTNEGVILMAATNRPDVLDKALLRPGRFDRRVIISLPDIKGRLEILKVHARKIKIDPTVDLMAVARSTPGASGAELENLLNEAALHAARVGRSAVTGSDITEARDKVLFGKERRSLELDSHEKKTTAYHESGHTVVGLCVDHADPVDKVTIIPRGFSLGATHFLPEKNKLSYWKKELIDQLAVLMGGRAAEEVFLGDISSGAQQDISQATQLAKNMVCRWGMTDTLGLVAYDERHDTSDYGLSSVAKGYSEETAKNIDAAVHDLVTAAYARAIAIVTEKKGEVELMTEMLMEFETLDSQDVRAIMDHTWDPQKKREKMAEIESHFKRVPETPPPLPDHLNLDHQSKEVADGV